MFPVTVKHVREVSISRNDLQRHIADLCHELKERNIDSINVNDNRIDFSVDVFSRGRNHPMAGVDKGYFEIDIYSNKVIYSYSTLSLFVLVTMITIPMGIFIFFTSGFWPFCIIGFLWMYGMNWLFIYVKQRSFFKEMIKKLNLY